MMTFSPGAWFSSVAESGTYWGAAAAHVSADDPNPAAPLKAVGADPAAVLAAEQP